MLRQILGFSILLAVFAGCGRSPQVESSKLPLRRVVIYRNGVGYFERRGAVEDDAITFKMRQKTVGDFLGTLAIVEQGGSSVRSASFPIEIADKFEAEPPPPPVNILPGASCPDPRSEPKKEKNPLREVVLRLDGKRHDLAVGYVAETPVWKPSYRVVMHEGGQAELQSWGIVQNLSGEDWNNVELVLVAGAPLAFQSTLGEPVTPTRPIVNDTGEVIDAMPEAVTSVQPSEGEVDRYEPEASPLPPLPGSPTASGMASKSQIAEIGAGAGAAFAKDEESLGEAKEARRTSAGAPKPQMMPAPGRDMADSAPSAPRNRSMLASVAVESGATRYAVPYSITIPDESATMVLVGNQRIPGENVFLFAPDGGVMDSASHPFRVARFTNKTAGLLERGPIAVFEKGSFLGQGVLDSLPPNATATVPFALERGIAVSSSAKFDQRGARLFKVELGQIIVERDSTILTTYILHNGLSAGAKVLVRHPRRPGTQLFRPPPGTEDDSRLGSALIPISVKQTGRTELVVDERRPEQRQVGWLEPVAEEAVRGFLSDSRSDPKDVERLGAAFQIQQAWRRVVDEQNALAIERAELERNLNVLRGSLRAIEKNDQAADLRQKLTKKLGETTTRLDQLSKRLVEVELAIREHEVRFRDAVEGLKILRVPPPSP